MEPALSRSLLYLSIHTASRPQSTATPRLTQTQPQNRGGQKLLLIYIYFLCYNPRARNPPFKCGRASCCQLLVMLSPLPEQVGRRGWEGEEDGRVRGVGMLGGCRACDWLAVRMAASCSSCLGNACGFRLGGKKEKNNNIRGGRTEEKIQQAVSHRKSDAPAPHHPLLCLSIPVTRIYRSLRVRPRVLREVR